MVYRFSLIAGIAAIAFALWRLGRLLEPTEQGIPWQIVLLAALVVGAVLTWTAISYRVKAGWIALLNLVFFVIAAGRYGAPDTGFWILPSRDTVATVAAEIERASGLIRHGIEPVSPIIGLVIVLAALFWSLGALVAYGLLKERPFLGLIPPLVVGLQLMTIERKPSSNAEIALFVLLVAMTALAVGVDEHDRGAGRMAAPGQHARKLRGPLSRTAVALVALTVIAAIGVSGAMANRIPADGVLTWRAPGSLTAGLYGSITLNPYVEIHRGLVTQSETPLFSAELSGAVRSGDVYYRLVTLDTYDDGRWFSAEGDHIPADEGRFEEFGSQYAGPKTSVTANVTIHRLGQDYLPAPYAIRGVAGEDAESFRVRTSDASLLFSGNRTYNGMQYSVVADMPTMDSGAVAVLPDGSLSPLFQVAEANDNEVPAPQLTVIHRPLTNAERYLQLPDGLDPVIAARAIELTEAFGTDFEKGLALEYWFRESGGFVYDLTVDFDEGHGPEALARWLFDDSEANPDHRRGYCEDFATSMGVMARAVGIPTRVVIGFLPGESRDDGSVMVRGTNGHSWIELWIPSQGWMRFDPTPRSDFGSATYRTLNNQLNFDIAEYLEQVRERPPDNTPLDLLDTSEQPEPLLPRDPGGATEGRGGNPLAFLGSVFLPILVIVGLLLSAIPVVKWTRRRTRMRRLARGDIGAAWDIIVAQLADLDRPVDPASTPKEVAESVGVGLRPLASVYTKSIYGPDHAPTVGELDVATQSLTVTEERLVIDLAPSQRMRATYRLASLVGGKKLSRWLPWLRP